MYFQKSLTTNREETRVEIIAKELMFTGTLIVDIHEHDYAINRQGPSHLGFKYLGWKLVPDILVRC